MRKNSVYAVVLEVDEGVPHRMVVNFVVEDVKAGDYHQFREWKWYTLAVFERLHPAADWARARISVHDEEFGMSEEYEWDFWHDDVDAWEGYITKRDGNVVLPSGIVVPDSAEHVIRALSPEVYEIFRAKGVL